MDSDDEVAGHVLKKTSSVSRLKKTSSSGGGGGDIFTDSQNEVQAKGPEDSGNTSASGAKKTSSFMADAIILTDSEGEFQAERPGGEKSIISIQIHEDIIGIQMQEGNSSLKAAERRNKRRDGKIGECEDTSNVKLPQERELKDQKTSDLEDDSS